VQSDRKRALSALPNESHQKLLLVFLALLGEATILVASRLRVKMDLQNVGCGVMDWIKLAQDRGRWCALVNGYHKMWGIS
jgi:hypothetical protein